MDDQTILEIQPDQENNLSSYLSDDPFIQTDHREHTLIETPKGNIAIVHEMTLGDIIISVSIIAFLILNVFQSIRR